MGRTGRIVLACVLVASAGIAVGLLLGGGEQQPRELTAPAAVVPAQLSARESAVADTIARAAETRSADQCAMLATQAYIEQRERRRGEAALAACQNSFLDRDSGLVDAPLHVTAVEIDGDVAIASVQHGVGGPYSSQAAELRLVRVGKVWKLDRVLDLVGSKRDELDGSVRYWLTTGAVAFPKPVARCANAKLAALGDARLERELLSGSALALYSPALRCDRRAAAERILAAIPEQPVSLPPAAAACATRRLVALGDRALTRALIDSGGGEGLRLALECDTEAVIAAYGARLREPPFGFRAAVVSCVSGALGALSPAALSRVFLESGVEPILERCRSRARD